MNSFRQFKCISFNARRQLQVLEPSGTLYNKKCVQTSFRYLQRSSALEFIRKKHRKKVTDNFVYQWHYKPLVQSFATGTENNDGLNYLVKYEQITEETLNSITEYFEDILEADNYSFDSDVSYSNGVLTVNLGKHGTYVINKQTPNRQIWLSSPTSGPKRYDFVQGMWIYKHNGISLHELLSSEISSILSKVVDFTNCSYGQKYSVTLTT